MSNVTRACPVRHAAACGSSRHALSGSPPVAKPGGTAAYAAMATHPAPVHYAPTLPAMHHQCTPPCPPAIGCNAEGTVTHAQSTPPCPPERPMHPPCPPWPRIPAARRRLSPSAPGATARAASGWRPRRPRGPRQGPAGKDRQTVGTAGRGKRVSEQEVETCCWEGPLTGLGERSGAQG